MTKSRRELSEDEQELIKATRRGDKEKVIELLAKNTNPNAVSQVGFTAFQQAVSKGYWEVADLLFEAGADVNDRYRGFTNDGSLTYLGYLAAFNSDKTIKLMDYNPDPDLHFYQNDSNDSMGNSITPLHDMIKYENFLLIQYCLNIGGNPNIKTRKGEISSQWARERENPKATITLLEKFEQLHSLATAEISIDEDKSLILKEAGKPSVALQLPDKQDLKPQNLERFIPRFLKNLLADKVTSGEKFIRFNSNLNLLSEKNYYPELLQAIKNKLNHPLSLQELAVKKIVANLKGVISAEGIDKLGMPPLQGNMIKQAGIPSRPSKPSNGPSR